MHNKQSGNRISSKESNISNSDNNINFNESQYALNDHNENCISNGKNII